MKKRRVIFGLGLALISGFSQAQGLDNIIVEKYYISNTADVSASGGKLLPNSVTYRVYVDMATGYKLQAVYGDVNHALKFTTSTSFFNSEDRGATTANAIGNAFLDENLNALDSWFSMGASTTGNIGVLKSEDNGAANLVAAHTLLKNNAVKMGIPLTTQDGNYAGTVQTPSFAGFDPTGGIFDATSLQGGSFITNDGAIAVQSEGVAGPLASNRVLIGQFTTDGVFRFELNLQLKNLTSGAIVQYVSSNPTGTENTNSTLILEPNIPPVVSITSPANNAQIITNTAMTLTANATDADGSVTSVEFFVDGVSVGTDATSPYSASYTALVGSHTVYAVATDNSADADQTTSTTRNFSVANNQAPTVSVSAATTAIVGDVIAITATAADVDGSVAQIEFFVDNVSVGVDNVSPFTNDWTAVVGAHTIKAIATDNLGLTTTSSIANISVAANNPPTAIITAPLATATIIAPTVVTITATATDSDGSVTGVEFFINNVSVGTDATSPYSLDWTSTPGVKNIIVKSTDNKGAITTSSVLTLNIADPNALPYEVVTVSQKCNTAIFNIPVAAAATNTVDNVIGYQVELNYDKTKVTPTGNITVLDNLINHTYVQTSNSIDATNGKMNIALYFNGSAPNGTEFNGIGNIFTVEFSKTPNFTSVDEAVISVPFLQESYVTGVSVKATSSGKAKTFKDFNFIGELIFWKGKGRINYNSASPNDHLITNVYGTDVNTGVLNANNVAVQPDVNGSFSYDLNNGLGISINKDIAPNTDLFSILTGDDAALGKLLLLNDPSFTPSIYQAIALDVNLDGVISAGDISQMQQRTVLKIPEFKQAWNYTIAGVTIPGKGPSKDWIFVDSLRIENNNEYKISATFPLNDGIGFSKFRVPVTPFYLPANVTDFANCPAVTAEKYKGILLGDVDGNLEIITNPLVKSGVAVGDRLVFDFTRASVNGTSIDVPVSIVSTTPVRSFDFQLTVDENNISFNETVTAKDVDGLGFYNTNDKTLRFTASNTSAFDITSDLLVVRFDLSKGSINTNDFKTYKALLNGKAANIELKSSALGLSSLKASENAVSIYPNPTSGLLNIVANEKSTVEITDLTGKKVMFETSLNANEKQEINISDFSNGMYIVKVYNENFNSIERIVVNK